MNLGPVSLKLNLVRPESIREPMKLIHFADNHLGAGSGQRTQDMLDSFAEAIDRIIEARPDMVINAGDMFHVVRPSNRVIAFATEQLLRLGREHKIPTVIISGNHDAPRQSEIAPVLSIFRNFENIHVICDSRFEQVEIGQTMITAVPHCLTPEIFNEELDKVVPNRNKKYNILVLHGVVDDMEEFRMADLSEQTISHKYFERGFDYVALGHYHNHKRVAPNAWYSGSTERLSQSEAIFPKGIMEVELNTEGIVNTSFHEITSRVMRDLPELNVRGKTAEEVISILEKSVGAQDPADKIIRQKVIGISEEVYRSLPFDRLERLKNRSFSLDVKFEKEEKVEKDIYADLNLGRLDKAFEKFLESMSIENLDRERLKEMAINYLHRAQGED